MISLITPDIIISRFLNLKIPIQAIQEEKEKKEGLSVASNHLQLTILPAQQENSVEKPNKSLLRNPILKNPRGKAIWEEGGSQCRCEPFAVDGKKEGFAAPGQEATLGAMHNIL